MPVPVTDPPPSRRLLRDDVFARLRDAIIDGTLEPGEQLRDQELARWLGVSRTPIREALLRLQQAGLVATRPGRSTVVTSLDERSVREACSVVAAMHQLAVTEAVPRLTAGDLDAMRTANELFAAALRQGDVEAALRADDELHHIPVAVAANRAAAAVIDHYTPALRRAERLRFASHTGRQSVDLHQRLIDLCAAGDATDAGATAADIWRSLEVADRTATGPTNPATVHAR
jgi:DNA-binding GntR family transcriptional regulator